MLTTLSQRLEVWTVLDNFCEDFVRNLWDVRRVRHAIIDNARSNSEQAIFFLRGPRAPGYHPVMLNIRAEQQGAVITITLDRKHAVALAMALQDRAHAEGATTEVAELETLVIGSPEWQKGGPIGPISRGEVNDYRIENGLPIVP